MAGAPTDWQLGCTEMKQRGGHLLQSGQWSDCTFLVGTEPNQVIVSGHKLILAMASPVFEAMFYGGMAERNDPIPILDVQPEAFKALLEYIYTDNINISSFDKACELCYGAKKYMLPHLVKECTRYLWSDLYPRNACRAYEFARLFEENVLMEKCIQIISTNTKEVLNDSSFEEVELNTVITVFSLDHLNIDSELDLFEAAVRYAKAQEKRGTDRSASPPATDNGVPSETKSKSPLPSTSNENEVNVDGSVESSPENTSEPCKVPESESCKAPEPEQTPGPSGDDGKNIKEQKDRVTIRSAIEKIRFLTLTATQFASGPARSALLSQAESFAVLMNILSSQAPVPMPAGFSTCRVPRNQQLVPQEPEGESKSEVVFRFTVLNFKTRRRSVQSRPFSYLDMLWAIKLVPRYETDTSGFECKYFGLYLECAGAGSGAWAARVRARVRLVSHERARPPLDADLQRTFTSKESVWGFERFVTWDEALNPERGLVKGNAITIEAHLVAD